jgi:hypothetical protein
MLKELKNVAIKFYKHAKEFTLKDLALLFIMFSFIIISLGLVIRILT